MKIIFSVPQVLMLGQFLLNLSLADLFLIINDADVASYVDDNIPYIIAD